MIHLDVKGRKVLVRIPQVPTKEMTTEGGLILPSTDLQGNSINNKELIKMNIFDITCTVVGIGDKVDSDIKVGDKVMVAPDSGFTPAFPDPNDPTRELQLLPQDYILAVVTKTKK